MLNKRVMDSLITVEYYKTKFKLSVVGGQKDKSPRFCSKIDTVVFVLLYMICLNLLYCQYESGEKGSNFTEALIVLTSCHNSNVE